MWFSFYFPFLEDGTDCKISKDTSVDLLDTGGFFCSRWNQLSSGVYMFMSIRSRNLFKPLPLNSFLLTIPRRFFCCSFSLFMCQWFHVWHFLSLCVPQLFFFQCLGICYITKISLSKYTEHFTTKKWKFLDKKSMFLSRNQKNKVYPCKPQFYYIKVGIKGVNIIEACFRDEFGWSFTAQSTLLRLCLASEFT